MDGRPRRAASMVDYSALEHQYDETIRARIQEHEKRSSPSERDGRKRKRESDSPKEVHHFALREGLRNSVSINELVNCNNASSATEYYDRQDPSHDNNGSHNSTLNYNDRGRIIKLHIGNSAKPPTQDRNAGRGNGLSRTTTNKEYKSHDSYNGTDGIVEHGLLDAEDLDAEDHRHHHQHHHHESNKQDSEADVDTPQAGPPATDALDSADEESDDQYMPRKSIRRSKPVQLDESESEPERGLHHPRRRVRQAASDESKVSTTKRRTRLSRLTTDEDEYVEESAEEQGLGSDSSLMSESGDLNDFIENDESTRAVRRTIRSDRRSSGRDRAPTTRILRRTRNDENFSDQSSAPDLQAELEELRPIKESRIRQLRDRTNRPDYAIPPPLTDQMLNPTASPRKRGLILHSSFRSLYPEYSTLGLGIASDPRQKYGNFGPPKGLHSDSDSSDEEGQTNKTAAKTVASVLLPAMKSMDQSGSGGPSNLGKVKGSNLADADPIGIDKNVSFDSVGGLQDQINQLKEMVSLPLLYPEIFQRFHITPPRGVLFHGPPGTGKTLMARALAASCSSEGRKISFYMRKGADCLSKWVGEAERQLRLLFEEAKVNQPSIIFFDEIDGLAPVRSAKQDQIHASIVSTLLALMDGMDARGQVVVIGATNRPDSVDPALRRPGRFDREFYFPLPALEARKHIIKIHTSLWEPPLEEDFRTQLAVQTKGYGGADLRALCTEAALNAVQRRYPQIYASKEKLVINPASITVVPRDFMQAIKKIVPSSARSATSGAAITPKHLKPLIEFNLSKVTNAVDKAIPRSNHVTDLEQNFSVADDESTFEKENMLQMLESMRTFRPRILVSGKSGLGQHHIGRAVLHHLEGFHVQNIDLAMMFNDSASTPEASLILAFVEAKRHKPSVLFMPAVELWFNAVSDNVIATLRSLLASIPADMPLLLLGIAGDEVQNLDPQIIDFFGHLPDNNVFLDSITANDRTLFFKFLTSVVAKSPSEFPDVQTRRRRKLEVLAIAPPTPARGLSKAEKKALEAKDRKCKLVLKSKLGPLMELIRTRYKRFKKPSLDEKKIGHLLVEPGQEIPDDIGDRDYQRTDDGLILEVSSGKRFYNMDTSLIEERLWSNLYLTPKQFQTDIEQILHDVQQDEGDRERFLKAQEMHTNVLIHLEEMFDSTFLEECKAMAMREVARHDEYLKAQNTTLEQPDHIEAESAIILNGSEQERQAMQNGSEVNTMPNYAENLSDQDLGPEGQTSILDLRNNDLTLTAERAPSTVGVEGSGIIAQPMMLESSQEITAGGLPHTGDESMAKAVEFNTCAMSDYTGSGLPQSVSETQIVGSEAAEDLESLHDPYTLDEVQLDQMLHHWVSLTDGCSVDQLEEINSAGINAIWLARSNWNRNTVATAANRAIEQIANVSRR